LVTATADAATRHWEWLRGDRIHPPAQVVGAPVVERHAGEGQRGNATSDQTVEYCHAVAVFRIVVQSIRGTV